jgi:hypothetical protein
MAKILMTAIVADIRNKLNGSVFSKNRYGSYIRTKVTPVNPQTTAQQNVRNRLATNSQAWRGLTESQRNGWITAASSFPTTDIFGNPKILSGNALYVSLNNNLAVIGAALITDAPSPVSIPALSIVSLTADISSSTFDIDFLQSPIPAGVAMVVEATPQVGPGISFVKNLYRNVNSFAAATNSPIDLFADYVAKFGALTLGQKVFVRCFYVSTVTGQAGIAVSAGTVIVA